MDHVIISIVRSYDDQLYDDIVIIEKASKEASDCRALTF
jgi:hypothetical protein